MQSESLQRSAEMLRQILYGKSLRDVSQHFDCSIACVQHRVRRCFMKLYHEVGINGVREIESTHLARMRQHRTQILEALEKLAQQPAVQQYPTYQDRVLSDRELARIIMQAPSAGRFWQRDRALLFFLLATGAALNEISRLTVHDYLQPDGSVRRHSEIPAQCALGRKARQLFLDHRLLISALDDYLSTRPHTLNSAYRGLNPRAYLFLDDDGQGFYVEPTNAKEYTNPCLSLNQTYRRIFRLVGAPSVTHQCIRRTLMYRLAKRGATPEQISQLLGVGSNHIRRRLQLWQPESMEVLVDGLMLPQFSWVGDQHA